MPFVMLQNGRIMLCIVTFVFFAFLLAYRYAEQSNTDKGQFISIYPHYDFLCDFCGFSYSCFVTYCDSIC
jgi:hypothetical protein